MGTPSVCLLLYLWKQFGLNVIGRVKRADKRGQKLLLRHVYILLAHVYDDTCTHFCPVTRRMTMLPPHSSIYLNPFTCGRWKPENACFEIWNKRNSKMLRERGCWTRRGEQLTSPVTNGIPITLLAEELLPRLPALHSTHGFYLWSFHSKLTRNGVVLMCLSVWFAVSLIVTLISSRLQIIVRIELSASCQPLLRDLYPLSCSSLSFTLDLYNSLKIEWSWGRWKLGIKKRESSLSDKMCLAKCSHTITLDCSPAPYFEANVSKFQLDIIE